MKPVPIEPGQFALAFPDHYFDDGLDTVGNIRRLVHAGCGWDHAPDLIVIHHISKVNPKTYEAGGRKRLYRDAVIATAQTEEQAQALRAKLIAIGDDADDQVCRQVAKLAKPIEKRVVAKAMVKLEKALPHIFGRSA